MESNSFDRFILSSPLRQAMPIAMYPGMELVKAKVKDVVHRAEVQVEIQSALHERYKTPVVLSAMDLSAEAECFGCEVAFSDNEVPSILGRRITSLEQAQSLPQPKPGDGRTGIYLETVGKLKKLSGRPLVMGGCIGPFSLAARLVGVSEAMELTALEPELMSLVVEKSAQFLAAYASAFKAAGADGLIMAEPAAGLLSPRSMALFSSTYVRQITAGLATYGFAVVYHNCAARMLHLSTILETGLSAFHFGVPMDLPAALKVLPSNVVICGNLDPAAAFCQCSPQETESRVAGLLAATTDHRNYVLSSGCDLPPNASLAHLDAFYRALAAFNSN